MTDISSIYYLDKIVEYVNDIEYRQTMRELFLMKCFSNSLLNDIDEVSQDELLYDETTISNSMNMLFEKTQDNPLFQELYDLAAARMFSTNREIGQAVLFSYDYLLFFHCCLVSYFTDSNDFTDKNIFYQELKKRLK
jgi:hypothetical protein